MRHLLIGLVAFFLLGCVDEGAVTNATPTPDTGTIETDPGSGLKRAPGVLPDAGTPSDLTPIPLLSDAMPITADTLPVAADTLPALVPDALPAKKDVENVALTVGEPCVDATALLMLEKQRANWVALRAGKCSNARIDAAAGVIRVKTLIRPYDCDAVCVTALEAFYTQCPQNTGRWEAIGPGMCVMDANECMDDLRKPGTASLQNAGLVWYKVLAFHGCQ